MTETKIKDKKNIELLCSTISLIEKIYGCSWSIGFWDEAGYLGCSGLWTSGWWQWDVFNSEAGAAVFTYLRKQAAELKRLEGIAWRKAEADQFRKEFDEEFRNLTCLLLLSKDRTDYFEKPEAAVVDVASVAPATGAA